MFEQNTRESLMTEIWYEILPVTLESGHVVSLRLREDGEAQTWRVPSQTGRHPNDTVLEHVERFFGDLVELDASIVHSTSWRYCQRAEYLILTYLVVLPARACRDCQAASNQMIAQRVGKGEPVHGDHLRPPERIETNHILAHALDHLALLSRSDASIHAVLESEWLQVLETRLPRPAGYIARTTKMGETTSRVCLFSS
jgi:hypothetical protein